MVVDLFVEVDLKARILSGVSSLLALAGGVTYVLLLLQTKTALDEARVRVERRRRKREKMAQEENEGH